MRMRVVLAVAATLLLVGPATSTADASVSKANPVPKPIPTVYGKPGKPVTLKHKFKAGDLVEVFVHPLPMCTRAFTLRGPRHPKEDLATHDPALRVPKTGTWSWTFKPCSGDKVAYALKAVPWRNHRLKLNGPPVALRLHRSYNDAASFVPPARGRVILLGRQGGLVGPDGTRVMGYDNYVVFDKGMLMMPVAPKVRGRYTVMAAGRQVRLVSPTKFKATVDGPAVKLAPIGGRPVGEYAVEFSVDEDTWLWPRLTGWSDGPYVKTDLSDVEPLDGQPDPTRTGAPWHLVPGRYVARIKPSYARARGSVALKSVVPGQVTEPGDFELTADADLPGLALYDLADSNHTIEVVGPEAGEPGWTLTWTKDAPPKPCVSALDCMSKRPGSLPGFPGQLISGQGYLALVSTDGEAHTVTVRIGAD